MMRASTKAPRSAGAALAEAAETFVGARFRLHGRDPASGLDCIGLLGAALMRIGRPASLPAAYSLRTRMPDDIDALAQACALAATAGSPLPGDVALVRIAATQLHLLIASGAQRFIHAHAGLRRVVVHDAALAWPLVALWHLTEAEG